MQKCECIAIQYGYRFRLTNFSRIGQTHHGVVSLIVLQQIKYKCNLKIRRHSKSLCDQQSIYGGTNSQRPSVWMLTLDSSCSTRQLEVSGASPSMKSSTADLWTHLLWTILFIRLMRESSGLLSSKICSALVVKSHLSRQCAMSQLETTVLDSSCRTYKYKRQHHLVLTLPLP